jgi:hypothetical protein
MQVVFAFLSGVREECTTRQIDPGGPAVTGSGQFEGEFRFTGMRSVCNGRFHPKYFLTETFIFDYLFATLPLFIS